MSRISILINDTTYWGDEDFEQWLDNRMGRSNNLPPRYPLPWDWDAELMTKIDDLTHLVEDLSDQVFELQQRLVWEGEDAVNKSIFGKSD